MCKAHSYLLQGTGVHQGQAAAPLAARGTEDRAVPHAGVREGVGACLACVAGAALALVVVLLVLGREGVRGGGGGGARLEGPGVVGDPLYTHTHTHSLACSLSLWAHGMTMHFH